jgi:hypothetical protein
MKKEGGGKEMARKYILIWILSIMFIAGYAVYAVSDEDPMEKENHEYRYGRSSHG